MSGDAKRVHCHHLAEMSSVLDTPDDLLQHTSHRPFDLPTGRPWVMAQTWQRLLFAHWAVSPDLLRPMLPPDLTLDTYDGDAWVGVVPFLMNHVRLRGFSPIWGTAKFPELNLRTYVTHKGKAGVWFFSLDAANPLAVWTARLTFNLPYFHARMSIREHGDAIDYRSQRKHRNAAPAEFFGHYMPTAPVQVYGDGSLERWLTERYVLYSVNRRGELFIGHITHKPWKLQVADAEIEHQTIALASNITLPDTQPLLHYVHHIDVLTWAIQPVE